MSEGTCAVLLDPAGELDMREAAAAFVEVFGGAPPDYTRQLRNRPGVLAQELKPSDARRLELALRNRRIAVFTMTESEMAVPPEVLEIRDGRIQEDGFHIESEEGAQLAPWREILLIDCSRVRYDVIHKRVDPSVRHDGDVSLVPAWLRNRNNSLSPADPLAGMDPGDIGAQRRIKTETRSAWREVLDVICYDPWLHIRIDADTFRYVNANMPLHPTSHLNFTALTVILKSHSPRAETGPGVALLLDGDPKTRLRSGSLEAFENHLLWRLQLLWRKA